MTDTSPAPARWLEYVPIDELMPAEVNPKGHETGVIDGLINRFGLFDVAAVIDERTGRMIAGHGRRERLLAKQAAGETPPDGVVLDEQGRWTVPTYRGWRSNSDAEAKAAGAGHNQATTAGGWDHQALAEMLQGINLDDPDLLAVMGFPDHDLEVLLAATVGDTWQPPAEDGDLDQWAPPPPSHVLTFSDDEYADVTAAVEVVREREGADELTEAQALAAVCRAYLGGLGEEEGEAA